MLQGAPCNGVPGSWGLRRPRLTPISAAGGVLEAEGGRAHLPLEGGLPQQQRQRWR